jgi:nucleotide-binding universal stress UspA family protein
MFHSILVPLDGSSFSEQALPLALTIARRAGIPLQVAHVHLALAPLYAYPRVGFENTLDPKFREQERAYLDGVVPRLGSVANHALSSALLDGPVPEALLEHVAARGADLVVMSSHGRGPLSRLWLGSVTDHFVRRSSVPVLVVRPRDEKIDLAKDATLEHVIIPLDGSEEAEFIIEPAVALGRLLEADYTLLRVVEPAMVVGHDPVTIGLGVIDLPKQELDETRAKIYLDRVAERLRQRALRVHTCVVTNSHVARAIVAESERQPGSIIAIQTHARRGLARLLLGSVADKVLRSASVPVLISRPHIK